MDYQCQKAIAPTVFKRSKRQKLVGETAREKFTLVSSSERSALENRSQEASDEEQLLLMIKGN